MSGRAALLAGLLLASLAGASRAAEGPGRIQLYVMPDTQAWAWNQGGTTLDTWRAVARALCRERERFAMVLHTGDVVDNPRLRPEEWSNARSVLRELDACRMPLAIAFGNHDFDNHPPPEGAALAGDRGWRALVAGLAHQPAEKAPSGRSALHPLAPDWFVLTAAFHGGPDRAWLAGAIEKRPDARFLLLHHLCVTAEGLGEGTGFAWCRRLVEEHPQLRIVVSGHWLGARRDGWNRVTRAGGPPLLALFQNYQHVPELAAWGVVIELDTASGAACVWSENLLSGAVGHPAASAPAVGRVRAGPEKTCFEAGGADPIRIEAKRAPGRSP